MIAFLIATVLAVIITMRAIRVCNKLIFADRGHRSLIAWEVFGWSYALLGLAAGSSLLEIVTGQPFLILDVRVTLWAWLLASAGLILTDKRPEPTASEEA